MSVQRRTCETTDTGKTTVDTRLTKIVRLSDCQIDRLNGNLPSQQKGDFDVSQIIGTSSGLNLKAADFYTFYIRAQTRTSPTQSS